MSEPASSSFGGLKDFSVDAQRRMFIEQQERERIAAENKKESRKIKRATAGATGVELSGLMSNLEAGNATKKTVLVGDDDDDSIADDDWSLNSEESFYVGIERADYAQPDNTEMYGESKDDDYELKEDRLGISRVSVAVVNREQSTGKRVALDWDADIPIVHESKSSSLYDFMNGTGNGGGAGSKGANTKKDIVVAMPLIGSSLEWKEESKLGEEDGAAIDQVYQHKAAEGKMFIEKLVGSGPTGEGTPMPGTPSAMSATTPASRPAGAGGGNYPVLSPMALFSPGITTPGAIVDGEDNGVRQMRERELRKEASVGARQKMADLKKMIATTKDNTGKVDAFAIMKQLEKMMEEEGQR